MASHEFQPKQVVLDSPSALAYSGLLHVKRLHHAGYITDEEAAGRSSILEGMILELDAEVREHLAHGQEEHDGRE